MVVVLPKLKAMVSTYSMYICKESKHRSDDHGDDRSSSQPADVNFRDIAADDG